MLLLDHLKRDRKKLFQEPHMGVRMGTQLPDEARGSLRRVDKIGKELIDRITVNGRATRDLLDQLGCCVFTDVFRGHAFLAQHVRA